MKRLSGLILTLVLIIYMCGCGTKKQFSSENEMQTFVDGTWKCDDSYYIIEQGELYLYSEYLVAYALDILENSAQYNLEKITFEDFYNTVFYGEKRTAPIKYSIEYDYNQSCITSDGGETVWFTVLKDGTGQIQDRECIKISSESTYIKNKIKSVFENGY